MTINSKKAGFMMIEALTVLFIFALISVTFYSVFSVGMKAIINVKNRLSANSLANEKMEIVRNLNYANIGTIGGIPAGNILSDEDVAENGKYFHVKTLVQYIDDPLDGLYPNDSVPNDYKRVKITVSWNSGNSSNSGSVYFVSNFVPYGLESGFAGGVLAINIVDNSGLGVPQANVNILNSNVSPAINLNVSTDDTGNLMFPGAPQSTQNYQLIVSKPGYETVATFPPYPLITYYPTDVHASVIAGALNVKTVTINKLSNLNIFTADGMGNKITGVGCDFVINGGRILGTENDTVHTPVYNIKNQSETIDMVGEKVLSAISPGQYTITPTAPSGYFLVGVDPVSPFSLLPNSTLEVKIKLASMSRSALSLTVVDNSTSSPIIGAQVELKNSSGYDSIQTTGLDGVAFFQNGNDPLVSGTYDFKISAIGYQNVFSQETINVDELKIETIKMSP
jgi:type II secretory pathway pseudopilin PulG